MVGACKASEESYDRSGHLVDIMLSEHRDMAAAQAFFRSAKAASGITPDQVTTDGHGSFRGQSAQFWAGGSCTGPAPTRTISWSKIIGA
jgi:DDE domain